MTVAPSSAALQDLSADLQRLVDQLPNLKDGDLIYQALIILIQMAAKDGMDRLDWKILRSSLRDLRRGFQVFSNYRHIRKITVFGSSRLSPTSPEYQLAVEFARCVCTQGYMVMTGAGGGIMEAANKGAGAVNSFGLNIQLPFEQGANPYIEGDAKLVNFKYFFTRKLFFLRETDAVALFPGGFGTQDEAFECLTLSQTGKSPPIPVVLVDRPGGSYWQDWDAYIAKHLTTSGLISPEDHRLYTITDDLNVACEAISSFYRIYHSSRYIDDRLILRLNQELTDAEIDSLNQEFADIILTGKIEKSGPLPEETQKDQPLPQQVQAQTEHLPRLSFHFNQRDHGRLYQMIRAINEMGVRTPAARHPELK